MNTQPKPVLASALVREHTPKPASKHLHKIGPHQVSLKRIKVFDFYAAKQSHT